MKKSRTLLVVALCLVTAGLSAQKNQAFKNAEVKMKFVETVKIKSDEGNVSRLGADNRWLRISTVYETISSTATPYLDDVEMKYEVIMPSAYKGRSGYYALFTGTIQYWSIPMDGKEHRAVAFIPPQIIRRYKTPDEKLKRGLIKTMYVRITFYGEDRKILGYAFNDSRKISKTRINSIFKRVNEPGAKVMVIKNSVYGRNKTPWSPLNFDFYELIKDESQQK